MAGGNDKEWLEYRIPGRPKKTQNSNNIEPIVRMQAVEAKASRNEDCSEEFEQRLSNRAASDTGEG